MRRGIVLAGGAGTRLYPLTISTSKQLLPAYNKPVIFYPLQTLKDMGYEEILIITAGPLQEELFKNLLGNGEDFGLKLSYIIQDKPRGLADAFIVGEDFIKDADEIALILGDNIIINHHPLNASPNTIFTYKVNDPSKYGVASLDKNKNLLNIVEKPQEFISDDAVIGLYVFNNSVIEKAKHLKPSKRGELEIVDLIKEVQKDNNINVKELEGFWFDVGDFDSLLDCGNLIRTIEKRTNMEIGLKYQQKS